jgi:hypothetical protein
LRSLKEFIVDLVRKPPILFPLVGLFHILWLFWTIWDDRFLAFPGIEWLQVLWMIGYTVCWLAVCDLRKWGALGYIALTVLNVALHFAVKNGKVSELYMSNLFLVDGIFSLFLVFYYKLFR